MSQFLEEHIIGTLLYDPDKYKEAAAKIKPEMFIEPLYGDMFREFQKADSRNESLDLATLIPRLTNEQRPEHYLLETFKELLTQKAFSSEFKADLQALVDGHRARELEGILNHTRPTADNINELLPELISDLMGLMDGSKSKSKSLPQIVRENKENYFKSRDTPTVDVGIDSLDEMLGGLEGGDLIIIGARPAVGKSAFATQMASHMAKSGKKVAYYNLEMQEKQVYERFVSARSGIGLTRLRRALAFTGDEKPRFEEANAYLETMNEICIVTGSTKISIIKGDIKTASHDVVIVDYLQLIQPDSHYRGNRYAEVGAISHGLKQLAMEANIPVIVLSQLNRVSEAKETREPTMSELRESGDIEQDASIIMLLWNEDAEDFSKKGLKIEKHRQGRTGKLHLTFDGDTMSFKSTGHYPKDKNTNSKDYDVYADNPFF